MGSKKSCTPSSFRLLTVISHLYIQVKNCNSLRELTTCESIQQMWRTIQGEYQIRLKADAQPVLQASMRVPKATRKKIKTDLKRMVNLDIIVRVDGLTLWISSIVTIIKPRKDRVQICLDPKGLNDAIERERYPLKIIEEAIARMPNVKVLNTPHANSTGLPKTSIAYISITIWAIHI